MFKRTLILTLIVVAAVSLAACGITIDQIEGSGTIESKSYDVSDFDGVTFNGVGELVVAQGNQESLTLTTDDNIVELYTAYVENDTLIIELKNKRNVPIPRPTDTILFELTVVDLSEIEVNGAGRLEIDDFEGETLVLGLNGAGDIDVTGLAVNDLTVDISGAGDVKLSGEADRQTVVISGLGNYEAEELELQDASVELSGGGSVKVWANENLDVTMSGAGNVIYYGNPRVVQDVTGAGNIEQRDK